MERKFFFLFAVLAAFALWAVTGCGFVADGPFGWAYTNSKTPVTVGPAKSGSKKGRACIHSYFGLFAIGDANIETAMKLGGITEVYTIDKENLSVFGTYTRQCTVVTGEEKIAEEKEAPKEEAAKQEAPKEEAAKQEAPKQEAAKQEAPKQEAAKQEAPKQEAPKQEAPKQEAPKQEAPKQEAPKQEAQEAGKVLELPGKLLKVKLPNGIELNVPELGVEKKLIVFIEDASKPVDRTTWFTLDRLEFETGSADFKPSSMEQLKNIAEILKAYPKVELKIGGYTDNTGSPDTNRKLSQRRANNTMQKLVKMGVDAKRLEAEGYGEKYPVADNSTNEGRQRNRRIDLRVTNK
jgi:outer membrane protein OmpA-like peptidoglycan-associated protein